MFSHYIKITLRNLRKQKGYTFINIFGLAMGLACCILILLFVLDELSYDRHYPHANSIYRVAVRGKIGDHELNGASTSSLLARTLLQEYPEVINATRLHHTPNMLVRYGDRVFNETHFMWVDTNFFDIFAIPLVYGDPATALKDDHTVVMTLEVAAKFFDNPSEAIGEIVTFEDGTPYRVSGIAQNAPQNSHFHYGMLSPLSSWEWNWGEFWLNNYMYTYIHLHDQADPAQLEAKFPGFVEKYLSAHIQRETGLTYEEFRKSSGRLEYYLQPLTDIHLHSQIDAELEPNSDIRYIYIFSVIAVFILLIACVNFMNLSTARSAGRTKEVGIRKVLGSTRPRLVYQYLTESIVLTFIAVLLSALLVILAVPFFNDITGKMLNSNFLQDWHFLPAILLVTLLVGILAGSYPAFLLSSFRPSQVLKGALSTGARGKMMRSLLVIFQFSISIILFISTFVVYHQLQYIQNKRLGFDKENVVVIKRGWAIGQKPDGTLIETPSGMPTIESFKNDLVKNPQILSVSGSTSLPGKTFINALFVPEGAPSDEQHPMNIIMADYDFAQTFNLEFSEGRYYSREMASDSFGVVLNETAARIFGFELPVVGKRIRFPGNNRFSLHVIGVVKDFHYESLHKPIQPLLLGFQNLDRTYISVRIRPERVSETIRYIEKTWLDYIPYKPFEYFFFDEDFDQLYRSEQQTAALFSVFSLLAVLIACLGLFGLASYTTERRTKEIGVRKTMGASVPNIVLLLTRDFIKWIILANLIAWPIAWYFMDNWLQNFAYRAGISAWIFILAAAAAMLIAFITVSYQSIKAALSNPVDALRYE